MNEKEHPILGEIMYLISESLIVRIVIIIIFLAIASRGFKCLINFTNDRLIKANNMITEMMDEKIEPIVEYKTYKVVKCDVERGYLRFDEYIVVLQSDNDSLVLEQKKDYDCFLPYFGKEIILKITRHGVNEDYEGYMEYEIMN